MANYLLQPDGSNTCCDCPDRAGPCDDCGGCALPEDVDCPHAICFELKLDASDTADRDFLDVQSGSDVFLGVYFDGSSWQVYTWTDSASVTAIDPFDTWHSFVFQFYAPGDGTIRCKWFVDSIEQTEVEVMDSGESPSRYITNNILFGAHLGSGDPHRTLRKIAIKGNPDTAEEDFDFPTDSFDSLVGGASVVGDELQINASDSDSYGEKDADPAYDLLCVPVEGCMCIRNVEITVSAEVSVNNGLDGDSNPCSFFVHKEETLATQFGADLCGVAFGPFSFVYPEYDNGQITLDVVGFGLSGSPPPPICMFYSNLCSVFFDNACGAGFTCYSDPATNCFTVCEPPGAMSVTQTLDLGSGDYSTITLTVTIT